VREIDAFYQNYLYTGLENRIPGEAEEARYIRQPCGYRQKSASVSGSESKMIQKDDPDSDTDPDEKRWRERRGRIVHPVTGHSFRHFSP
jgi:hypothetical protein